MSTNPSVNKQSFSTNHKAAKFVKIGEASHILGVSIDTLRRWEKSGKIETVRTPGGTRLYKVKSLAKIQTKSVAKHMRKAQRAVPFVAAPIVSAPKVEMPVISAFDDVVHQQEIPVENSSIFTQILEEAKAVTNADQTGEAAFNGNEAADENVANLSQHAISTLPKDVNDYLGKYEDHTLSIPERTTDSNVDSNSIDDDNNSQIYAVSDSNIEEVYSFESHLPVEFKHKEETSKNNYLADDIQISALTRAGIINSVQPSNKTNLNNSSRFTHLIPSSKNKIFVGMISVLLLFILAIPLFALSFNSNNSSFLAFFTTKNNDVSQVSSQVLAESTISQLNKYLEINADTAINGSLAVEGEGIFIGNITAPNIVYSLIAGQNITISGDPQNPTISATDGLTSETDTLASVTARGASTSTPLQLLGGITGNLNLTDTLVLGRLSSDPGSATNGATYYNTGSNKFRCYINGSWQDCDTDTDTIGSTSTFSGFDLVADSGTAETVKDGDTISLLGGNGILTTTSADDTVTFAVNTGKGLTFSASQLTLAFPTSGTSAVTTSNSGLELTTDGLSLIRGCGHNEIMKWDNVSEQWECGVDQGLSGAVVTIKDDGVDVSTVASILDFTGNNFDLTEAPAGEVNISLSAVPQSLTGTAGNFDVAGTLVAGTGNSFSVSTSGSITLAVGQTLTIGTTSLNETTGATDSGAYLVSVFDEFANSNSTTVQGVLNDLDAAVGSGASKFSQATGFVYLTSTTDDFVLGGSTSANGSLYFDESAGNLALGTDGSLNGMLTLLSAGAVTDPTITTDNSGNIISTAPNFNTTSTGINSTAIGQTTAAAGSFTSITASGTLTANGAVLLGDSTSDTLTFNAVVTNFVANSFLSLEGATADGFETTLNVTDPTADNTITIPNNSGTVVVAASGPLSIAANGTISCATCLTTGSAYVASLNGLSGALSIANASGSGATITIDDATTTTKGIASFASANFAVTSGAVSIKSGGVGSSEIADGSVANADLANSSITVTGGTGISTSGSPVSLGGTVTVTNTGVTSLDGGAGSIAVANATFGTGTLTIDDAATGSKGIASFNSSNFSVSAGAVSVATGGIGATELAATTVSANSYGGQSTGIATFTVDADGRLTAAATTTLSSGGITDDTLTATDFASTLSFADGDYVDLSAIVHDDTGLQGLRLPNTGTTPSNPVSGEGQIAYDATGNSVIFYNGSAWQTVATLATAGDITSVVAGSGLTGGGTSGDVTLTIGGSSTITVNADDIAITADSVGDTQLAFNTGQNLTTTSAVTFATVDTGQGANELYDMNQNVMTTSAVTFDSLTLTNALSVANGGTGAQTLTGILIGNGTGAFTATTVSTGISGQLSDETGSGALVFGTSPTLTSPRFADGGFLADSSGNEMLILDSVASAVNQITLTNSSTGNGLAISATGDDTNVDLSLDAKGAGVINIGNTSTGNLVFGGGSASTGCTLTNSSGAFACTAAITASNISGSTSGTNTGDQTITLTGDVSGSGTGSFATTIQANAVALSTDTTGDYVATITGSGTITSSGAVTGEGIAHTLSITANSVTATQISSTLTFADGDYIDLSPILHDDTALQGLRLPNTGTSPSNPTSGEGNIAYDATGNNLIFYNGTAWQTVATTATAGDITAVIAGSGLTGGGTSGDVTLTIGGSSTITVNADDIAITADSVGDTELAFNTGQNLTTTSAVTFATVDTGQGANELYDMNQNVMTTSAVTFDTLTLTNALSVANGGTGAQTLTGILLGNGTSAVTGVTTSAGISGALSDETGSGALVFGTSPTLTTPRFADGGFIADSNGNELLIFDSVASAVNELTLTNAATGNGITLAATGGDTDIAVSLDAKGAGVINIGNTSTGNLVFGGGSASTGCTLTNSSGAFACTAAITASNISGSTSGTNTGDQTITLTGDVSGSGTGSFATTIQANSVALTTDTTGDYVGTITGSGTITSSGATSGEGIAHTLSVTANSIDASHLAATLTFGSADYLDFSAITHGTTALQGIRLPNAASATPSNPVSGEGQIAYDATTNAVIFYNGSAWVTVADTTSGGGDITAVTAGAGLTGGGTTGAVTLTIGGSSTITVNADDIAITADSVGDTELAFNTGQNLTASSGVTFATVDTGQGANELFDMDQNVLQASAVTFATLDTGFGANELYDMDQNVLTTSSVTFDTLTLTNDLSVANGGTGASTFTAGGVLFGNTTSAIGASAQGTSGQALISGGSGSPTWTTGTLTLAGNFITSGVSSLTLTTTGSTNVTLPTTGTLCSTGTCYATGSTLFNTAGTTGTGSIVGGDTFTITGNATQGVSVALSGDTFTATVADATTSTKGVASYSSSFFTVTSGAVSIAADSLDFTELQDTLDLDANQIVNQGTNTWTQNFTGTTTNGLTYNANNLTSGQALSIASTSTALTSGGLASLDWSPGSATTATGDLFALNIGTNGTIGNIFNIKDAGSSIFSVSESALTSNIPVNFTSPGDVAIAYDLNFTNPVASFINSASSMNIVAGEIFNSSNLYLKTYNQGTVVIDSGATTGTSFELANNNLTAGTAASFTSSSITSGSLINVAQTTSTFTGNLAQISLGTGSGTAMNIANGGTGYGFRVNDDGTFTDSTPIVFDATGNVLIGGTAESLANGSFTLGGEDLFVAGMVGFEGDIFTDGDLNIGAIGLNDVGSSNTTSGASLVGVFDEFTNSSSTTVQDVLDDLDAAISGAGTGDITAVGDITTGDAFTTGTPGNALTFADNGYLGLGAAAGRIGFDDLATDEVDILTATLDLNTGLITNIGDAGTDFTSGGGLTIAGTVVGNGQFTLGDNGDTGAINTSDWDISTTGAITNATYEGLTITSTSGTLALANSSTLATVGAFSTTLTATGTTTVTLPISGTLYGTATGSITSSQLLTSLTDETGSGAAVFATSPTFTTPSLGAATATSINGLTLTSSTGTLTIANGKTLTANNTLTFDGTDGTTFTFPGSSGTVCTTATCLTSSSGVSSIAGTANQITASAATGAVTLSLPSAITTPGSLTTTTTLTATTLLTASNGFTQTTGALNLTSTSGAISSTGLTGLTQTLSSGTAAITAPTINLNTSSTGNTAIGNATGTFALTSNGGLNVTTAGVISGATGITSSGTITLTGLGINSAVYTNGSSALTTTAPTSGALGYWTRTGSILTTTTGADSVTVDGALTSNGVMTLGDGGDNFALNSNALDISTAGAITNATGVTMTSGNFSSSGDFNINRSGGANIAFSSTASSPGIRFNSAVVSTGQVNYNFLPAAHINQVAEKQSSLFAGATYTITGGYATQRFNQFDQFTVTAGSALNISSEASTMSISGAPIAAGSATIANSYALKIDAGTSVAAGVTNAYGLYVSAPTGATNNYGGVIATGNFGIGDTTPDAFAEILGTTEQLRITHTDGSKDARFTVDTNGLLTIDTSTDGTVGSVYLTDDLLVGASTETLANTGFVVDGNDLFVSGMAGVEGNIYTDGSFIAGASTTISNGSISQSSGETLTIGTTAAGLTLQTTTSGTLAVTSAGALNLTAGAASTWSASLADSSILNLSAINVSGTGEGLILPQNASACALATAEGQVCWDTAGEDLYIGNGATAIQMNGGGGSGTVTETGTNVSGQISYFTADQNITSSANFIIDPVATTGTAFALANNSLTTGTQFALSGTGFTTGEIADITGTWAPTDGSDNEAIDVNLTFTPTSSAATMRGLDLNLTEGANALANTDYGVRVAVNNSANTSTGTHSIYGGYFSAAGKTAGTTTAYGVYGSASGADTNYALYSDGTLGFDDLNGTNVGSISLNSNGVGSGQFNFYSGGTNSVLAAFRDCCNDVFRIKGTDVASEFGYGLDIANTESATGTGLMNTFTQSDDADASDIGSALQINVTSSSGDADILYALEIANLTAGTATETALKIGTGWDNILDSASIDITGAGVISGSTGYTQSSGTFTLTPADGSFINLSAVNVSSTTEGLRLPQTTSCTSGTAEGQICWDTDNDTLYIGDGATANAIGAGGATTWNGITNPTGTQTLTFDDGELNAWTVSSNTETFWSMTADSLTTGKLFDISLDGLTSGTGFNMQSTSTALAGTAGVGSLMDLDWSPGSATTSTNGDLFSLVIGANGTLTNGNIFGIYDGSISTTAPIFGVSETAFTTSLPANFTAAGDVAVAYDINMTNPTASFIKSAAPLYLTAGETFNSSNLTLQTYNQGSVVFDTANTTTTAIDFTSATLTTGTGLNASLNALTTGVGARINSTSTAVTTGTLLSVAQTGVTTTQSGATVAFSTTATTNASARVLTIAGNAMTTGTAQTISANALTTGSALAITSTSAGRTSGNLFSVVQTGATTSQTGSTVAFSTTATTNAGARVLTLAGDAMTLGTVQTISANLLTTGSALAITSTSAGRTSGNLFSIAQTGVTTSQTGATAAISTTATTDAGARVLTLAGDAMTQGTVQTISANLLTTGSALAITSTSAGRTSGNLFSVVQTGATTSQTGSTVAFSTTATTNAGARVLTLAGDAMTQGTVQTISGNLLTSGSGLSVASSGTSFTGDLGRFELTGNSGSALTGSALKVGITGTSASGNSVGLNVTNGNTGATAFVARFNDDGTYSDSTPFVIDGSGKVGIGVEGPSSPLHVAQSVADGPSTALVAKTGAYTQENFGVYIQNSTTSSTASIAKFGMGISSTGTWNGTTATNFGLLVSATGGTTNIPIYHNESGAQLTNGGVWTNASDRNLKENFTALNGDDLLNKIDQLSITEWNYISEPTVRHIGPTAQDFKALFGLGNSDKNISTIDPSSIALVAVQTLNRKINNALLSINEDGSSTPEVRTNKLVLNGNADISGMVNASNYSLDASNFNRNGILSTLAANTSGKATITDAINILAQAQDRQKGILNQVQDDILGVQANTASQAAALAEAQQLGQQAVDHALSLDEKVASTSSSIDSLSAKINELLAGFGGDDEIATSSSTPRNDGVNRLPSDDVIASDSEAISNNLVNPTTMIATDSAELNTILIHSEATVSGMLQAYDGVFQNSLKSLGDTFLGNTTVAGDLSVDGSLSITGSTINSVGCGVIPTNAEGSLDSARDDNSCGTLFLQTNPLAELVDLFNGAVQIAKNGNITVVGEVKAASISTDSLKVTETTEDSSIGSGTITAGEIEIPVFTNKIGANTKVFVTVTSEANQPIVVAEKITGAGFVVKIQVPEISDITFDWFVVN